MNKVLDKILSRNETLVYNDLLKRGLSKPNDIAKRTKVPRNKVYEVLYKLESKELILSENSKTKTYKTTQPVQILNLARKDYLEKKDILAEVEKIYPLLKLEYDSNIFPQPYFHYTRGIKNIIKEIKEEIKKTKEFVYIFARKMTFFEEHCLINAYHHLLKKGVDIRIITLDNDKTKSIVKKIGARAIFLPEEFIPKRTLIIKENLFALSLYGQHEGIRLKTESKEIIETFKSLFLSFWNTLKELRKIKISD